MTPIQFILYILLVPCILSAVFVYLVISFSKQHQLYDSIGGRKIHSGNVPRLGGVGFFTAMIISFAVLYLRLGFSAFDSKRLWFVMVAGALVFAMGLWDDLKNWKASLKFFLQCAAACLVVYAGYRFTRISFAPIGFYWSFGMLSYPITILWIVGVTNAINLMDGIDGQVGCLSASVLVCYAILFAILKENVGVVYLCLVLSSALLGFLFFNLARPQAKIFMGDCGSQFLGFVLAVLPLADKSSGDGEVVSIPFAAVFLMLPIFDTIAAIWRRIRENRPVREGDKFHLHHKLLLIGFSQRGALTTVMILQIIVDLFVTQAIILQGMMALTTLVGLMLVGFLFFALIHFEKESRVGGHR
ncbi:MAG: MraY family glycosyltransferase [Treponema sp.]